MANYRATALQAPGGVPTWVSLRGRCNHCYLLRRPCRNGTTTTPCDRCREQGVLCTFSPRGSHVDKHIPGRKTVDPSKDRPITATANEQNENGKAAVVKDPGLGPVSTQTLVEEAAVKEPTLEEDQVAKPKSYMVQGDRFTIFTQDHIDPGEDATMSAWESLTTRQTLGYHVMAYHEDKIDLEMEDNE